MINIKRHKVADILDKMQFFQGSMAGRELWFDKPKEVQAQDCDNFTRDIRTIRDYILQIEEQANKKVDNWIPCSERLPEKRDWCLALFKEPYTGFVGLPKIAEYLMGSHTAYTTKEGWIISNCTDREDVSSEYYKDLICDAWMPLPNPYNANRGVDNE